MQDFPACHRDRLIGVEDYYENPATGALGGTRLGLADLPPTPDSLLASARRSFVAALEYSIHLVMQPDRKLDEPMTIGIMRNLKAPVAMISIGQPTTDGTWHEMRLIFAPAASLSADEPSGAWLASSQRLQVWAYLPAVVIPLLGDLLADRLDVTAVRSVATPAEEELSRTGPYIADKLGPVTAILKMMPDWIPLAKEAGKMMAEHSKELATEAALECSLNPDTAAEIARQAQETRAQDITNRLLKFGGGAKRSRP
jgi:hypothetical protein